MYTENARLMRILVGTSLVVMSFGTFLSAYLRQGYTETISFFVRDGWCNTGAQGIGEHCFGDFYAPMTVASDSNPWLNDLHLAYTPVSFFYFRLLNSGFVNEVSTHLSLMINLFLTLLALSIPGLFIWRHQQRFDSISGKWVLLLSWTAAPSLIMIDRGSSSFLLFPAVFFFYLGIQNTNYAMASWALIIMGLWKPQSLILIVGIYIFFGVKPLIKTSLKFLLIFSTSFLLYPNGLVKNVLTYIQNSRDYQNYVPIPTPGNYSLINFIGFIKGGISFVSGGLIDLEGSFRPPMDRDIVSTFCVLYALAVLILFTLSKRTITRFQFILYSSVFMLTIAGTTFGYYLSLMLIPLLIISRVQLYSELQARGNRIIWTLFCILLFSFVPAWPLNWGNLPINVGDSWSTLGVHWTLVHVIVSVLVFVSFYQLLLLSSDQVRKSKGKTHE